MPSNYAHFRLGEEVRACLKGTDRQLVELHSELYRIGLHGPDIFFHYKPLTHNEIKKIGYAMHDQPGRVFFEHAARVIAARGGQQADIAYIYGFLCHFALDMRCHGYVEQKVRDSGVSHTEIETEFDRMLMLEDGLDPLRHRLTGHIIPSAENAEVVQAFFPGVDGAQVQRALKGMISDDRWLLAPSRSKRLLVCAALKFSGNEKELRGLLVNRQENPLCRQSNERLSELYDRAVELSLRLIGEFRRLLGEGLALGPDFDFTFDPKMTQDG